MCGGFRLPTAPTKSTAPPTASRIAAYASTDPKGKAALEADIFREFAIYMRRMLAGTVMRHRFPRLFQAKQRWLRVRGVFATPRVWRVAREKRDFWRRLTADGACPETISGHRREIAAIEETLDGADFTAFVQHHAPELAA